MCRLGPPFLARRRCSRVRPAPSLLALRARWTLALQRWALRCPAIPLWAPAPSAHRRGPPFLVRRRSSRVRRAQLLLALRARSTQAFQRWASRCPAIPLRAPAPPAHRPGSPFLARRRSSRARQAQLLLALRARSTQALRPWVFRCPATPSRACVRPVCRPGPALPARRRSSWVRPAQSLLAPRARSTPALQAQAFRCLTSPPRPPAPPALRPGPAPPAPRHSSRARPTLRLQSSPPQARVLARPTPAPTTTAHPAR